MRLHRSLALVATSAAALLAAGNSFAEAEKYVFDSSHSQVLFSYNHLGFSTTYGLFAGFSGEAMLDADNPANSSVKTSWNVSDMMTGWKPREDHFLSADFFDASQHPTVSFESTKVEVTGDKTAKITGNLTMAGVTKEVVLDATLNQMADHPMANSPWAGFDAHAMLLRSDFGLDMFAPFVSDEVHVQISVELQKAP